jgi:protein TonB
MPTSRSQVISLTIHTLLALLLVAGSQAIRRTALQQAAPIHVTPLTFFAQSGGGGSNRTALPAQRGSPPPKAHRTFIPPTTSDHPPIALPITIAFDIPLVNASANIGDPYSQLVKGAFGSNGDNGIGNHGCCEGIGESPSGPPGLGVHRGSSVTPPQLIYKMEPEFSEEARKAKYQGVVVLTIEVDSSGHVRNLRVRQGLGLGLDEKAIEAVSRWRFRPAIIDGKPVTTEAVVQVNFRLL